MLDKLLDYLMIGIAWIVWQVIRFFDWMHERRG